MENMHFACKKNIFVFLYIYIFCFFSMRTTPGDHEHKKSSQYKQHDFYIWIQCLYKYKKFSGNCSEKQGKTISGKLLFDTILNTVINGHQRQSKCLIKMSHQSVPLKFPSKCPTQMTRQCQCQWDWWNWWDWMTLLTCLTFLTCVTF